MARERRPGPGGWWVGALLLCAASAASCGDDDAQPCVTSADCPAAMTCRDGRCAARLDAGPPTPIDGGELDASDALVPPDAPPPPPDLGPVDDLGAADVGTDDVLDLGPADLGPPPDLGPSEDAGPPDAGDGGPARYPDGDGDRVPDALDRCPAAGDSAAFYEGFELADGWIVTARGPLPSRFAPWPADDIVATFGAGAALATSVEPGSLELSASVSDAATSATAGGADAALVVPARGELAVDFETVLSSGNALVAVGLTREAGASPTRGLWCGMLRAGGGSVVARQLAVWLDVQSSPFVLDDAADAPARGRLTLSYDVATRTAVCSLGSRSLTVPATGSLAPDRIAVLVAVGPGASDLRVRVDDLTLQERSSACP